MNKNFIEGSHYAFQVKVRQFTNYTEFKFPKYREKKQLIMGSVVDNSNVI